MLPVPPPPPEMPRSRSAFHPPPSRGRVKKTPAAPHSSGMPALRRPSRKRSRSVHGFTLKGRKECRAAAKHFRLGASSVSHPPPARSLRLLASSPSRGRRKFGKLRHRGNSMKIFLPSGKEGCRAESPSPLEGEGRGGGYFRYGFTPPAPPKGGRRNDGNSRALTASMGPRLRVFLLLRPIGAET